ncbi:Cysteine-rich RLK (RECEPTOR-like protein kinase) 8 [Theobroma cacao]|uniref:Cysteine-rich RLK (RECEPTOR-like protein kinase) 8 n=1 Tax=Theobroma cacao TaxID=3641 RepID=A0A061GBG3_THECC|nr:Cysteine-rich RLK (RECEPTOR-like protein kinase) 8 [Theobroma cacao]
MQALNLQRKFEMLRMKEKEIVQEFSEKLMKLVNQLRLFGEELTKKHVANKVLVSLPKKFDSKISSLEESRDIARLTLSELINALEAREQRKAFREEDYTDSAFVARTRNLKLGNNSYKRNRSFKAKVKIGNGVFLERVGTGTVAMETDLGYKYITNVYLVPDANQNLLNVGQLTESHYALLFKDRFCTILDPKRDEVLTIEMKNKCYSIDRKHTEHKAFVSSIVDSKLWHRRDIRFDEQSWWNWDKLVFESFGSFSQTSVDEQCETDNDEDIKAEHLAVKGTRSLQDIYSRCNMEVVKPTCYYEAAKDARWLKAMEQEMQMIEKNGTWILVDKPVDQHIIGVKWIYKTKLNADGIVNKFKARLVVKGYSQIYGIDYCETFAPIARHDTIRLLSALAAREGWKILHLYVKSTFLNGYVSEDIYIQKPEGFIKPGTERKVYKLVKALYGLKQAPRAWYDRFDPFLIAEGFVRSLNEHTLYVYKSAKTVVVIISLYVYDLLIIGLDDTAVTECKSKLIAEFEMTDLGEMHYSLGMQFIQHSEFICIHQGKYATELLKRFHMENSKAVETPLAANCKLRMMELLRLQLLNTEIHFSTAKRVLRYVKGTVNYGLKFEKKDSGNMIGYCDSDWARSLDDARSARGYCFSFGSAIFSWNSKKQEVVAQFSTESKYILAATIANQAIWIRKILGDLGFE